MIALAYETPIQQQLRPGEQLLWVGRPRQGFMLRTWDSVLVVLGLVWVGFAVRWTWDAAWWAAWRLGMIEYRNGPNLFRGMIVAAGLALFVHRFFADVRRRAAMWYAVTDRRMLFLMTGARETSVSGIEYHELKDVAILREFPDGSGTIRFIRTAVDPYAGYSAVMTADTAPDQPMFEAIPAAKEVYELVQRTRAAAVKRRMELMRQGFDADVRAAALEDSRPPR